MTSDETVALLEALDVRVAYRPERFFRNGARGCITQYLDNGTWHVDLRADGPDDERLIVLDLAIVAMANPDAAPWHVRPGDLAGRRYPHRSCAVVHLPSVVPA